MVNSISDLDKKITDLLTLVTNKEYTIDDTCSIAVALNQQGIHKFDQLRRFQYNEFDTRFTSYKEADSDVGTAKGKDVIIIGGMRMYLSRLFLWAIHRMNNKKTDPNANDPTAWTYDEFDDFCIGCNLGTITPLSPIQSTTIRAGNAPRLTSTPISRELDDWNRTKKDGESMLERLKQDGQWTPWNIAVVLKAKQEGWSRIIDGTIDSRKPNAPNLTPGSDDLKLYDKQNDYVNVILRKLVTTVAGINILDNTPDAITAYYQLKHYHEQSPIASARSVSLLTAIDQLRPTQFTTKSNFLSTFQAKVQEYESISPTKLDDDTKILKLQHCVASDDRLLTTMSTFQIAKMSSGTKYTKDTFTDMMKSLSIACNVLDAAAISKQSSSKSSTLKVLKGEFDHNNNNNDDDDDDDHCEYFDANLYDEFNESNYDKLFAFASASKQRTPRVFDPSCDIPNEAFKLLSDEGRKAWYKLQKPYPK